MRIRLFNKADLVFDKKHLPPLSQTVYVKMPPSLKEIQLNIKEKILY